MGLKQPSGKERAAAIRELKFQPPPLPHNLAAEESTVSMLLFDGRTIEVVADFLLPADFFHPPLEAIYAAMVSLARPTGGATSVPIDVVTVEERLENLGLTGHLAAQGGRAYLLTLAEKMGGVGNLLHHAVIVKKYSRARAVMFRGMKLCTEAVSVEDFDAWLAEELIQLGDLTFALDGAEPVHYRPAIHALLKTIEERFRTRAIRSLITGVPTGISALDEKTAGLQPGDFIIVAARPSMGKSAFMCCVADHAASQLIPTLIFSLEMSRSSLVTRLVCIRAGVKTENLKAGMLETRDWINLTRALGGMSDQPVWLDDSPQTIGSLRDKARRWRRKFSAPQCATCLRLVERHAPQCAGCATPRPEAGWPPQQALVLVDYLGRIPVRVRAGSSDESAVADISRQLKDLPAMLHCPVMVLAQLNRKCEERADKRPTNSDLRGSGSLEQDADVVLFLYRDEVYDEDSPDKGIAEIIIGKQRNGPTGTVKAAYQAEYGPRFQNLSVRTP